MGNEGKPGEKVVKHGKMGRIKKKHRNMGNQEKT